MLLSSRVLFYYKPNATIIPLLAAVVATSLLTLSAYHHQEILSAWESSTTIPDWVPGSGGTPGSAPDLAKKLIHLLNEHSPAKADKLDTVGGSKVNRWLEADAIDQDLMNVLNITSRQTQILKEAHGSFVRAVEEELPTYNSKSQENTQGIVTVAGGSYFPPLLVSLRLLRRTGTSLPVEIFLPKEEYEPELCEHVLPTLNGVCRTFDHFNGRISQYQYKIFAILLSSFAEVLWLDADNFPLHDVATLFASTPFRETGLVTWPDLWQTSVAPAYYEISSRQPTPVSMRASTESGQLLVSKEKHWKTLLLVAYYNFWGPDYYYPLLCQAHAGAGDKETFLPAAETAGLPFYDVKAPTLGLGHFRNKQNHEEGLYRFALIQKDPVGDYQTNLVLESTAATESDIAMAVGTQASSDGRGPTRPDYNKVRAYFLHMMTPKCTCLQSLFKSP